MNHKSYVIVSQHNTKDNSRKLEIIFDVGCDSVLVLFVQVGDLRLALQRAEQTAARKEDYLRHEISELQQVLVRVSLKYKSWDVFF